MKRILGFFFTIWAYLTFIFLMLIVFFYHVIVVVFTKGNRMELLYKSYRAWALTWAFINGVKLEITGREHLEKARSYIFVCNHGSTADIVIVAAAMTFRYRPLGKAELVKIPFMGFMFQKALVLVDRSSPESRRKSMDTMRELIRHHVSVLIAPEGTRNRTKEAMQPFKEGAFRLAIEFQLPVAPVVLLNTRHIYPNDSIFLNHGKLKCHFLPPVSTEGMKEEDIPLLKEKVFRMMESYYKAHDDYFSPA